MTRFRQAAGALREAMKCLAKSKNPADSARKDALDHRTQLIGQFVEGRKLAKTDTVTMFQMCESLLGHPGIDVGFFFALVAVLPLIYVFWMICTKRNPSGYAFSVGGCQGWRYLRINDRDTLDEWVSGAGG